MVLDIISGYLRHEIKPKGCLLLYILIIITIKFVVKLKILLIH